MISTLCWVPKGSAASKPVKYEISAGDVSALKNAKEALVKQREQAGKKNQLDRHGLPVELRMDDYGEEHDAVLWDTGMDEQDEAAAEKLIKAARQKRNDSDDESDDEMDADAVKDAQEQDVDDDDDDEDEIHDEMRDDEDSEFDDDEDDESDEEDVQVRDTDRMIVVAQTDEEYSNLEVYLFDKEEGSLYVHHDIALPAFPLCMTWVGCGRNVFGDRVTTESKNYIGVGTFNPEIEIWNLDVLDAIEPTITLGGKGTSGAHTDAVMGLDWNVNHHNLLASASGDNSVKLWDFAKSSCVQTFKHHSDKVQSVKWNPAESSVLLSGSFDKSLAVVDANLKGSSVVRMSLSSDVECCAWNCHRPEQVLASTEDGIFSCFDIRNASAGPVYSFQAHKRKPCSSFSCSKSVRGLLATCSPDKTVKLWNLENAGGPKCVAEKSMVEAGALFDVAFDLEDSFLLAAGGDKGELALWDINEDAPNVVRAFQGEDVVTGSAAQASVSANGAEAFSELETAAPPAHSSGKKKKGKKKKGKKKG